MGPKRVAAVACLAAALTACGGSKTSTTSHTECQDAAKGHNCLTITQTVGTDHYRVTDTWVYTPDAPVVDGVAPVHRSEWVATIDCGTRGSQFEQARYWDAQDREITLSASDNANARSALVATAIPPIVTAVCDSGSSTG